MQRLALVKYILCSISVTIFGLDSKCSIGAIVKPFASNSFYANVLAKICAADLGGHPMQPIATTTAERVSRHTPTYNGAKAPYCRASKSVREHLPTGGSTRGTVRSGERDDTVLIWIHMSYTIRGIF